MVVPTYFVAGAIVTVTVVVPTNLFDVAVVFVVLMLLLLLWLH